MMIIHSNTLVDTHFVYVTFIQASSFELHGRTLKRFIIDENNPNYQVDHDILYKGTSLVFCPPGIAEPQIKEGTTLINTEGFINSCITDCTFLPSSLTQLGAFAFHYCTNLRRVYIPPNVITIGHRCFESCSQLITVIFSQSIETIQSRTFYDCSLLSYIVIPYGVKEIQDSAFSQCPSLTHLTIPDSVNKIQRNAFQGSGIEKCGITCSFEERKIIKEQTSLSDSVFGICHQ